MRWRGGTREKQMLERGGQKIRSGEGEGGKDGAVKPNQRGKTEEQVDSEM